VGEDDGSSASWVVIIAVVAPVVAVVCGVAGLLWMRRHRAVKFKDLAYLNDVDMAGTQSNMPHTYTAHKQDTPTDRSNGSDSPLFRI